MSDQINRIDIDNTMLACFECGIKLATIFHQFIGTPVSMQSKDLLCKAIEKAIKNQLFVEDVKVEIDEKYLLNNQGLFKYRSLDYKMLKASVKVRVGNVLCIGRLEYDKEKDFPFMSIDKILYIEE